MIISSFSYESSGFEGEKVVALARQKLMFIAATGLVPLLCLKNAFEEFISMSSSDSMQSNFSSSSHPFPSEGAWLAPPPGFLKVNCDTVFVLHSDRVTAACVEIVKGSSISFFSGSASIAEAIAVRHDVLLAINEG
ncbi:hypothetical protein V6N13_050928 [Hibiscus sabdariffa]